MKDMRAKTGKSCSVRAMTNLMQQYENAVTAGGLREDNAQKHLIMLLQERMEGLRREGKAKGMYIHGPPGRGKSMLMDWFFEAVPTRSKRRVHFHAFMAELHEKMHNFGPTKGRDPMEVIADDLEREANILCFDEFYVTNIADGMLLGRLLQFVLKRDILLLLTSNWPPEDLFQGGVNRQSFLPFIRKLTAELDIVDLSGGPDYRYRETDFQKNVWPRWSLSTGKEAHAWLMEQQQEKPVPVFHFEDLCFEPKDREDYQQILDSVTALYLYNVPELRADEADAAIRFITLVDLAYESGVPLVCTSAVAPDKVCMDGAAATAYARCASRIAEMQGW